MPIRVDLDRIMFEKKMPLNVLAEKVGVTAVNLGVLKNGRAKAIRFSTLAALCEALECQPGDILTWVPEVE